MIKYLRRVWLFLVSAETMFPVIDVFQNVGPYIDSDG